MPNSSSQPPEQPARPGALPEAMARQSRAALWTTVVAGAFCVVLCASMVIKHLRSKTNDPLKSAQMTELKAQLAAAPKNEKLKNHIRELDLELRRRYFQQLSLNGAGGWMLLIGVGVLLLAAKQTLRFYQKPPSPKLRPDLAEQAARAATRARWMVSATGATVAVGFLALALTSRTALPSRPTDIEQLLAAQGADQPVATPGPTAAEIRQNWPRFRGPGGNGIASHTNVLLQWDAASGTGIQWKTPIPQPGFNSPIVWGDRIFLSGGDAKKREVMCFDLATGKLLWEQAVENVPGSPAQLPEIPEQTGFCAPTMATDGQRAYVIFANGDLAAFDFTGRLVWAKNLGVPHNPYGHASSLTIWRDRLIVQLDHGEAEDHLSKLYAFDGATGNIAWQRQRPVGESWASPIVIEAAGKTQIITLGLPWLMAHDAQEGTELWRAECLEGEVTPSPVFASNTLYVVSPSMYLMAVRPDGQGNVTETHIAWKAEDGIPDITSPLSNGELVWLLSTYGVVTCYDAQDGKMLWEHDYETDFNASPSLVGQRVCLFSTEGRCKVIAAGREFKEIAQSDLGEKVFASPAFVQNRMIVRGNQHLFCLGAPDAGGKQVKNE